MKNSILQTLALSFIIFAAMAQTARSEDAPAADAAPVDPAVATCKIFWASYAAGMGQCIEEGVAAGSVSGAEGCVKKVFDKLKETLKANDCPLEPK